MTAIIQKLDMKPQFMQERFEDEKFPMTFFMCPICHSEVVNNDTLSFREYWDIDRIARAGKLHEAFGKVSFFVEGYGSDPRPLYQVPEVRKYLRKLANEWPYFFYTDPLDDGFLFTLLLCMIDEQVWLQRDSHEEKFLVKVSPADIRKAEMPLWAGLEHACSLESVTTQKMAEEREQAIEKHLQRLFTKVD